MAGKKTGEERRRTPSVVVRSREETQPTIGIDGEDSTTGRRPRSSRTNDGSSQEHDCSSSGNSFVDAFCRDDSILCLKHLDDSIKDTIQSVNKSLIDEIQARRASPEPSHAIETNAMTIQLTINTPSVFVFRCLVERCVFGSNLENERRRSMCFSCRRKINRRGRRVFSKRKRPFVRRGTSFFRSVLHLHDDSSRDRKWTTNVELSTCSSSSSQSTRQSSLSNRSRARDTKIDLSLCLVLLRSDTRLSR